MSKWIECRIGNEVTLQQGLCINSKSKHLLAENGIPLLRITDLFNHTEVQYINEHKVPKKFIAQPHELIFSRTGQVGHVFKGRTGIVHNNCFKILPKKHISKDYLFWFLKTKSAYDYVNAVAAGAAQPDLAHGSFNSLPIKYPPLPIQRKIAAILSAYDELIENNNRRIAILEKMAEEIYREWFVRLRFPGYEKVKVVKGVPEGWEVASLGSIANFLMGQSPPSEEYNDKGIGLPFNQGVGTYGSRFPKKEVYCATKGRIAHEGEILFSVRAPVGRLNIADCEMIIGRGLCAIHHKKNLQHYMWYLLRNVFTNEDIIGNGAIYSSVGKDELLNFKILQPTNNLDNLFNQNVKPIDTLISSLVNKNNNLKSTRDLLLPRLISGKLDVENLDIAFPPGMEKEVSND